MIWAALGVLIATLIVGSSGGSGRLLTIDAGDRVDDAIADEAKREQIEAILEEAQALVDHDAERTQQLAERYADLAKSRESAPADFEALLSDQDRDSTVAQFIDLRFRLKNTVTAEEWAALFPPPGAAPAEE